MECPISRKNHELPAQLRTHEVSCVVQQSTPAHAAALWHEVETFNPGLEQAVLSTDVEQKFSTVIICRGDNSDKIFDFFLYDFVAIVSTWKHEFNISLKYYLLKQVAGVHTQMLT
jgi:hypothetical protein